jgi:hypothetical protein
MTIQKTKAWRRLGIATLLIVVVWTVVLPRLAQLPVVDRRLRFLDEHNIDPAALFYTDLECMTDVENNIALKRAEHPSAFWPAATTRLND